MNTDEQRLFFFGDNSLVISIGECNRFTHSPEANRD
jgi:hypothetical protein